MAAQFLPYLWGMETSLSVLSHLLPSSSYRTYEEWKPASVFESAISDSRSYRTYEEWKHTLNTKFGAAISVLTVPMRNGNPAFIASAVLPSVGSYRTYEEWKQSNCFRCGYWYTWFLPYLWGMETERFYLRVCLKIFWFLPYLWGMETRFSLEMELAQWVLTVPMRNGNKSKIIGIGTTIAFLPYLWGMETPSLISCWMRAHPFLPYLWGMETRFFEEISFLVFSRSYRTYEEWKRYKGSGYWWFNMVLTVPMRNGNFCLCTVRVHRLWVLTVPMRNGNIFR